MIILVEFDPEEASIEELKGISNLHVKYIKRMNNEDNSDYLLCELSEALTVANELITHLIIGGRMQGAPIVKDITKLPINIALVIDNQLINEDIMDFSKGHFIGIGEATDISMEFMEIPKENNSLSFISRLKSLFSIKKRG